MPNDDMVKALGPLASWPPLDEETRAELRGSVAGQSVVDPEFDLVRTIAEGYSSPQSRATLRAEARGIWQTSILPLAHPEEFDSPGGHQLCIGVDEQGRRWFYQPLGGYGREHEQDGKIVVGTLPEPGLKGATKRIIRETVTGFGYGGLEQGAEEVSQLLGRGGGEREWERLEAAAGPAAGAVVVGQALYQLRGSLKQGNPTGAFKVMRKNRGPILSAVERLLGKETAGRLGAILGRKRLAKNTDDLIEIFGRAGDKARAASPATAGVVEAAHGAALPVAAEAAMKVSTSGLRIWGKRGAKSVGGLAAVVGGFEAMRHVMGEGEPGAPAEGSTEEQFAQAVDKRLAAQIDLAEGELRGLHERIAKTTDENEMAALYREHRKLRAGLPPDVLATITRDFAAAWGERRAQNARRQALMERGWRPGEFHKRFMAEMHRLTGGKDAVVLPPRGLTPTNRSVRKAAAVLAGIPHGEEQDE